MINRVLHIVGKIYSLNLTSYPLVGCAPGTVTFYQVLALVCSLQPYHLWIQCFYCLVYNQSPPLFTWFPTLSTDFTHFLKKLYLPHTEPGVSYYFFFQNIYLTNINLFLPLFD